MKRIQLFEFTDQPWYPQVFRQMQTDYLQFVATRGSGHQNLIPLFKKAMQAASTTRIVDLCSGAGGPWLHIWRQLQDAGIEAEITLTDKFPSPDSLSEWDAVSRERISYWPEPVDALHVPPELVGMRTLFEGFHHFPPDQARQILADAADARMPIGIFEASLKPPGGWFLLLISPLVTILAYLLMTPFIAPRTFSRFLWTYLIPVVPLATCWDGVVSLLRVYSPAELQELVAPLSRPDYTWEFGEAETSTPVFVFTYLVGYPK